MKFSFVIPTMNSDLYLNDCLRSLDSQTYKNIELIIVDKNSTDNTHNIIKKYKKLNIKLFQQIDNNPENAVALGFKKCTGDFIQFLGSDDLLQNNEVLQKLSEKISINDHLVYCDYSQINKHGVTIKNINVKFIYDELLNSHNNVCATSFLFNISLFNKHGFDGMEGFDLHLMLRFGKLYNLKKVDLYYSYFRVHNQSHSGNFEKNLRNIKYDYNISRSHGGTFLNNYSLRYHIVLILKFLKLLWIANLKRKIIWRYKNF
jgi:glycosyltransferase involved in cell wall biosynthesis